jgi:hypothetical protein
MKIHGSKLSIFFFALLMGVAPIVFGKDTDKLFKASKATKTIQIDGKLDAEWQRTEVGLLEHFYRDESPGDRQKATFRMLWDEKNLYVFFECEDRFITARETQRDGRPYLDDCAEIFLIPVPAPLDMHFGFEINLYKASNDFIFLTNFHEGSMVALKSYNPEFEVEVSVDGSVNDNSDSDHGWTLELAIPLKLFIGVDSISPVSAGNRWAFQAIRQDRNDPTGDRRSCSTLFPLEYNKTSVHEPKDFGFLEFVD